MKKTWTLYVLTSLSEEIIIKEKKTTQSDLPIFTEKFDLKWALKEIFLTYWFSKNRWKIHKIQGKLVSQRFVFNKIDIFKVIF